MPAPPDRRIIQGLLGTPKGGDLPLGLLGRQGAMSSYTPTMREKMAGLLAKGWFGDTREGMAQAGKVMDVAEMTPVGLLSGMYDAGRAGGRGDYMQAGLLGGLAALPLPGAIKKGIKEFKYKGSANDFVSEGFANQSDNLVQSSMPLSLFNGKDIKASQMTVSPSSFNHWKKRIAAGERPSVLLEQRPDGTYKIVDGHSRATAYAALGISDIPTLLKQPAKNTK